MTFLKTSFYLYTKRCLNVASGLLCLLFLNSCEWGDREISLLNPDPDSFSIIFSDTNTVKLSSVAVDSMSSSGTRLLFGQYTDPYLGKTYAEAYLQTLLSNSYQPETRVIFDSLVLDLKYDYYYGDTTRTQTLNVHQLTENLSNKDKSYYNINKSQYNTTTIGTHAFRIRPATSDRRIKIRLSDELGKSIVQMGKNKELLSDLDWQKVFRGIALVPGKTNDGPMLGLLRDSTNIIIYSHVRDPDGITESTSVIGASQVGYSYTNADRTGTGLPQTPNMKTQVASSLTKNVSLIQSGLGVMTRIDLPNVRTFKANVNGNIRVNSAELVITPVRDVAYAWLTPPPLLALYRCNLANAQIGPVYNGTNPVSGNYVQPVRTSQQGQVTGNDLDNKYYYTMNITQYVTELMDPTESTNTMITSAVDQGEGLLLVPGSDFSTSFNRLVLGTQHNEKFNIKLNIYFTYIAQ